MDQFMQLINPTPVPTCGWAEFELDHNVTSILDAWDVSNEKLPSLESIPESVNAHSNWLVPNRLLIGAYPQPMDVKILTEHMNLFVSLNGEFSTASYHKSYPALCETKIEQKTKFIHFPIQDFDIPKADKLEGFVWRLRELLVEGYRMYLHCRGGHGRTAIVVIPLLCSLFDILPETAQKFLLDTTLQHRVSDQPYLSYIRMPETEEQREVAFATANRMFKTRKEETLLSPNY